jgi:hypothetical protein
MKTPLRVYAKATQAKDRSNAIVVSFDVSSYPLIRSRAFSVIIRKRTPVTFAPDWLYLHVNAPRSAICARARVQATGRISSQEAVAHSRMIGLSGPEIRAYVGRDEDVGCYEIASLEFPQQEVPTTTLRLHMNYFAPQSFFALSLEGKECVDRLCGFSVEPARRRTLS